MKAARRERQHSSSISCSSSSKSTVRGAAGQLPTFSHRQRRAQRATQQVADNDARNNELTSESKQRCSETKTLDSSSSASAAVALHRLPPFRALFLATAQWISTLVPPPPPPAAPKKRYSLSATFGWRPISPTATSGQRQPHTQPRQRAADRAHRRLTSRPFVRAGHTRFLYLYLCLCSRRRRLVPFCCRSHSESK